MKKIFIYLPIITLFFSSCSDDALEQVTESEVLKRIDVNVEQPEYQQGSRTNICIGPSGPVFSWAASDYVGIFPDEGTQVGFSMAAGAGKTSATFTGGGWGLKSGHSYCAYYPLQGEFYLDKTSISVDYTGQVQTGNNNSEHLGNFDYLVAQPTSLVNGAVTLEFKRISTIVFLDLTFPTEGTLTEATIVTDKDLFTQKGTINLTAADFRTIHPTSVAKEFKISMKNVVVPASSKNAKVYCMLPPVDLTNENTYVRLVFNGQARTIKVASKNFKPNGSIMLKATFPSTPQNGMAAGIGNWENDGNDYGGVVQ